MPIIAAVPFIGAQIARTAAWRGATALGTRFFGQSVARKAAGAAAVGVGGAAAVGTSVLGTLITAGLVLGGITAVGVVAYGAYKLFSKGGDDAQDLANTDPELAQALAPSLQPQLNAGVAPPPMVMQSQTPMMQGGMIPNAAYPTQSYPAAVVDMPHMMQDAPANLWQERVGGQPAQQGSYVQSLTDPAAIAAMNNQQIQ